MAILAGSVDKVQGGLFHLVKMNVSPQKDNITQNIFQSDADYVPLPDPGTVNYSNTSWEERGWIYVILMP